MNSTKKYILKKLTPEEQALRRAAADIREELELHPDLQRTATKQLLENATEILVAVSRMKKTTCVGRDWHRNLKEHMHGVEAWPAFDLLQDLGFVYCYESDNPCGDGWVDINLLVLGRYGLNSEKGYEPRCEF